MRHRLESATANLYIATEALVWFIVIRVLTTTLDHAALTQMRDDLERGLGGAVDEIRVQDAVQALNETIAGLASGPPLMLVLFTAFVAVFLAQGVTQLGLQRSAAAVVGVLLSVVVLNVVLHITLARDFMIWDNSGLASFFGDPQTPLAGVRDPGLYMTDPDPDRIGGSSRGLVILGMFLLWARFLYIGRGVIEFERALRSFSVGFPIVMIAVLLSRISGVAAGIFALPYFVLAMLTLAVANGARTTDQDAGLTKSAPWMVSAGVTLGLLAAVATLFGLVAVLEVERALTPIGSVILRIISWLLVIVLTPFFWVIEQILSRVLSNFDPEFLENAAQQQEGFSPEEEQTEQAVKWPGWIADAFRLVAFGLISLAVYYVGRYLFRRRNDDDEEGDYEEERTTAPDGTGLGGLLRNLVPGRRRREEVSPWMRRHAIYRLFARAVNGAQDRGFSRRPGETPLEFAAAASRALDASLFPDIAAEFDRARYGRHYPSNETLTPLDRGLSEWELAHPASEELRQAVSREAPEDQGPLPSPIRDRPQPPPNMMPPGTI